MSLLVCNALAALMCVKSKSSGQVLSTSLKVAPHRPNPVELDPKSAESGLTLASHATLPNLRPIWDDLAQNWLDCGEDWLGVNQLGGELDRIWSYFS